MLFVLLLTGGISVKDQVIFSCGILLGILDTNENFVIIYGEFISNFYNIDTVSQKVQVVKNISMTPGNHFQAI